ETVAVQGLGLGKRLGQLVAVDGSPPGGRQTAVAAVRLVAHVKKQPVPARDWLIVVWVKLACGRIVLQKVLDDHVLPNGKRIGDGIVELVVLELSLRG